MDKPTGSASDKSCGTSLIKHTVAKILIDSKTGEKFINLNGRKLKCLLPAAIPLNVLKTKKLSDIIRSTNNKNCGDTRLNADDKISTSNENSALLSGEISEASIGYKQKTVCSGEESGAVSVKTENIGNMKIDKNDLIVSRKNLNQCNSPMKPTTHVTIGTNTDSGRFIYDDAIVDVAVQTEFPDLEDLESVDEETFLNITSTELFNLPMDVDIFNNVNLLETKNPNLVNAMVPVGSVRVNSDSKVGNDEKKVQFFNDIRGALVPDQWGNLPIHNSVLENDIKLVTRNSLILYLRQESIDVLNGNKLTALQLAVMSNANPAIVTILLNKGASLSETDDNGYNIIHLAVECNREEILRILLEKAKSTNFNIDQYNYDGLTPLLMCSANKLHRCAELLLDAGANINVRDLKSGRTPLFHAAECHDDEMVSLLLLRDANTKLKNFLGTSPHDAMFEVEDIPLKIKTMIISKGQQSKRKAVDEPQTKKHPTKKVWKIVSKYKKVDLDKDVVASKTRGRSRIKKEILD